MSDVPQARRRARPGGSLALRCIRGFPVALALACGQGSLDDPPPATSPTTTGPEGGTLPPVVEVDSTTTTGDDSTGEPVDDDPRLCPEDCRVSLPVDWVYQGVASPPSEDGREPPPPDEPFPDPGPGLDPQDHLVPAMLLDPEDDSLTLVEQRDGTASLHRLDRYGQLEWNVALPLPCDVCDVTHIARHPSGDLLLSAAGLLFDRGLGSIAARYDPTTHTVVWATTRPLASDPWAPARSGEIAALPGEAVAQLNLETYQDFNPLQVVTVTSYSEDGAMLEQEQLTQDLVIQTRYPLLARVTIDGDLLIGIPTGNDDDPRGLVDHLSPPLWGNSSFLVLPVPLDDLHPDDRGHTLELGHTFDGDHTHLVLADRAGLEPDPRWIATLAFESTTDSRAALAVGAKGEPYAAVRTTEALGEGAEPLVGLSMARFTAGGELRWHTTVLDRLDPSHNPVELAVDDADGIIIAAVVDDRLRVERRTQRCECG